jgi:hypothetical protein
MSGRRRTPAPGPLTDSISTVIALGMHYIDSKLMLRNDFQLVAEQLIKDLHLATSWLGIPYPCIQENDETHRRVGVVVSGSAKIGGIRGFMRRINRAGCEIVLYCPNSQEQEWWVMRVIEGAFTEIRNVGRFDISQIDILQSLLLTQALSTQTAELSDYIELPTKPIIESCHEPDRGFFSLAHYRHVMRRKQT